jgi:hypothetical protein
VWGGGGLFFGLIQCYVVRVREKETVFSLGLVGDCIFLLHTA